MGQKYAPDLFGIKIMNYPQRTSFEASMSDVVPQPASEQLAEVPEFPAVPSAGVATDGGSSQFWERMTSVLDSRFASMQTSIQEIASAVRELQQHAVDAKDFRSVQDKVNAICEVVEHNHSRIGQLESEVKRLRDDLGKLKLAKAKNTKYLRRIVLLGLPAAPLEERLQNMNGFFKEYFPAISVTCSVFSRFDTDAKERKFINVGFAEFADSATRDLILNDHGARVEVHREGQGHRDEKGEKHDGLNEKHEVAQGRG